MYNVKYALKPSPCSLYMLGKISKVQIPRHLPTLPRVVETNDRFITLPESTVQYTHFFVIYLIGGITVRGAITVHGIFKVRQ